MRTRLSGTVRADALGIACVARTVPDNRVRMVQTVEPLAEAEVTAVITQVELPLAHLRIAGNENLIDASDRLSEVHRTGGCRERLAIAKKMVERDVLSAAVACRKAELKLQGSGRRHGAHLGTRQSREREQDQPRSGKTASILHKPLFCALAVQITRSGLWCRSLGPFEVAVSMRVLLHDSGSDYAEASTIEFDDDSPAMYRASAGIRHSYRG